LVKEQLIAPNVPDALQVQTTRVFVVSSAPISVLTAYSVYFQWSQLLLVCYATEFEPGGNVETNSQNDTVNTDLEVAKSLLQYAMDVQSYSHSPPYILFMAPEYCIITSFK